MRRKQLACLSGYFVFLLGPRSGVWSRSYDDLEVTAFHPCQFLKALDALVGGYRQAPVHAVVGHEHTKLLQPL